MYVCMYDDDENAAAPTATTIILTANTLKRSAASYIHVYLAVALLVQLVGEAGRRHPCRHRRPAPPAPC